MPATSLIRSALRPLVQRPAWAAIVIAGLAIGIAANTSIFSLVHGVLLDPLPYADPDRLVTVWEDHSLRDGPSDEWTGYATFLDWRDESTVFDALAAYSGWAPSLGGEGDPEQLVGLAVTRDWFRVLGVEPRLGRSFSDDEDRPGGASVAVLGADLWQRRFGGDPSIVGRTILLDETPTTVLGVLPADHRPLFPGVEIWRPRALDPARNDRGAYYLQVVGRLAPGVGLDQAQHDMDRVASGIAAREPAYYGDVGVTLITLHDRLVGAAKPALFALTGAVGLLLLVTCANVANLLLVDAIGRRQELAIRAGLGASRGRLIGRLLGESVVLAAIGGGLGLLFAGWGTDLLVAMAPAGTPRLDAVSLSPTVAAFAIGLTALTGIGFGILPALRGSRLDLAEALRPGSRVEGGGQSRLRSALVVAETAVALCLLVGAGLLATSFYQLTRVDLGFETDQVVSSRVILPSTRYAEPEQRMTAVDRLVTGLAAQPGVVSAAVVTSVPMGGGGSDFGYSVEGAPPAAAGHLPSAWYRMVTPDYFTTLGIPIVAGRPFDQRDRIDTQPVIAVSERFAARWFGDESALGKRLKIGTLDSDHDWMTIVAVVGDVRDRSPMLPSRDDVYLPYAQRASRGFNVAVVHHGGVNAAATAIEAELERLDPTLSSSSAASLAESVSDSLWLPRLAGQVVGVFALAALALAGLGLYGVLAHTVQTRRRELGIRAALGADRRALVRLVMRQGLGLAAVGTLVGGGVAVVLSGVLDSLLYEVEATDPRIFIVTATVLLATAGLAAWLPAQRASGADPASCLRQD